MDLSTRLDAIVRMCGQGLRDSPNNIDLLELVALIAKGTDQDIRSERSAFKRYGIDLVELEMP